ncbi:MAG: GNAT family N-acetyltransferase [Azonexus sp.]|jgi:CelD/BcsL family acetyltransferase involved in cellulose biosynthesis|nr:GNAT family N-acetyltransferase [Azonexus sp.]
MSWELLPAAAAFAGYAADWDRLNHELYGGHPYFDSRFVGPLLSHFAKGGERLCLYREQGVVRGAVIVEAHGRGRWIVFRPSQAQVVAILVADARRLQDLLRVLPGFAWSLECHAVDPRYAPSFAALRAESVVFPHALTIGVASAQGFAAYWQQRPKNLRSNIRRYFNRIEREVANSGLLSRCAPDEMTVGITRFGQLESAGWKGEAGTAVSIDNAQGRFYTEVLSNFAAAGQAEVCELTFDGQLAASRLLIGNEQMLVIVKTAYDETLSRFAPGRLLLYRLLEREVARQPQRVVEFYTNATRDQAEWATFSSAIHTIQLFRSERAVIFYTLLRTAKRLLRGSARQREEDKAPPPVDIRACKQLDLFAEGEWPFAEFALKDNLDASIDWFALLQREVYAADPNIRYYYDLAENGQARSVLPLRRTRQGWARVVESLSNYYTSLYSPLFGQESDPLALRHLLAAATREQGGADVMRFAPMDPDSPGYAALLNELRAIGWIPLTFFCFGNWFLKTPGGWADYLRERGGNFRSTIKRRRRKFTADGGSLELICDGAGVEAGIAAFNEVYSASWKRPEPYPDFVPALIRLLAARGMLRLGIARLQGRPVAAQLWMVGAGKASIYKLAYHEDFSDWSPGTVLTAFLMQQVIEGDQVKEVDFLIGDDQYKQIWMSDRRERHGIIAYNPRTLTGCLLLAKEVAGRLAQKGRRRIAAALAARRERRAAKPGASG